MVRLKVCFASLLSRMGFNFNSTMVRLKELHRGGYQLSGRFQFHYGTIKRVNTNISVLDQQIFQFHYGTIKRGEPLSRKDFTIYFNSTMVRLKGQGDKEKAQRGIFQFHYGTIKRNRRSFASRPESISIPLWYD